MFILLFSYIYQDYESLKPTSEFIDISQNQKEIKLDTNNKEKTQPVILEMNPAPTRTINNEDTTRIDSNKFYYNQLDNYSKLIYESLERQKENLKNS